MTGTTDIASAGDWNVMASVSPIKIDASTDRLVSDAAHFLGRTQKDVVDATRASLVSEVTGMSRAQLDP